VNPNMHLDNKKRTIDTVSRVLEHEGFEVKKQFKLGRRFYADIVGFKDNEAVLVEVKPIGIRLDQSDLMQVSGYMGALKTNEDFADTRISGCVIASGGTIPGATSLAGELGIHVVDSDKGEKIEEGIRICISRLRQRDQTRSRERQ